MPRLAAASSSIKILMSGATSPERMTQLETIGSLRVARTSSFASQPVAMTTSSAPSPRHASGIRGAVEMEGDARHAAFVEPTRNDRQHLATALQP